MHPSERDTCPSIRDLLLLLLLLSSPPIFCRDTSRGDHHYESYTPPYRNTQWPPATPDAHHGAHEQGARGRAQALPTSLNGLSSSAAAKPQMTDLTLDTLTIKSASGVHSVRISPPMKSLGDARVRLVDMAERAQQKLGLSDIRIEQFQGPRGGGLLSFIGVGFYFISGVAVALGVLRPGTAWWAFLDTYFPYHGAAGFVWLVEKIAVPVIVLHATEAWWMARSRLAKHSVEAGSALWLMWVLETFVEGFPAIRRFDQLVREEKRKRTPRATNLTYGLGYTRVSRVLPRVMPWCYCCWRYRGVRDTPGAREND